jgi:hypothetical protein
MTPTPAACQPGRDSRQKYLPHRTWTIRRKASNFRHSERLEVRTRPRTALGETVVVLAEEKKSYRET